MKPDSYSKNEHPDVIDIDRLRAGLLDHEPATRDALLAHVNQCQHCQERNEVWSRITTMLDNSAIERGLANKIRARRQHALHGHPARAPSHRPIVLALAAAVTALAIGLGIFIYNEPENLDTTIASSNTQSPDLYADIDFYLWLTEKQTSEDTSPNG